jgi:Icc-related predicted phosphoesterase
MKKITCISDTHTLHDEITKDLPGGDILIYAGDLMNSGRNINDIKSFCEWFSSLDMYKHKVFIAGNHDRMFQNDYHGAMEIVNSYDNITYLQDSGTEIEGIKIWGSPWQPWFYNWAFNLPRNGKELKEKWDLIPEDTDILITHGPAYGFVDTVVGRRNENLGCELLIQRILEVKPKFHVCGHIHTGYGVMETDDTTFINASVLNESYNYTQRPITLNWDKAENKLSFI